MSNPPERRLPPPHTLIEEGGRRTADDLKQAGWFGSPAQSAPGASQDVFAAGDDALL